MDSDSDPLIFLVKVLKVNMWKSSLFRIVTVLVVAMIEGANIYGLTMGKKKIHQYIGWVLMCQPGIVSLINTIPLNHKMDQLLKPSTRDFWPIDFAGKEIKQKILRTAKMIKMFAIISIVIPVGGYFFGYLPLVGDEADINPLILIFRDNLGVWSLPLSLLMYVYCPIFGFGIVYPFLLVMYLIALVSFQLELLKERLRMIGSHRKDVDENNLLWDKSYQDEVYRQLVLCIKHHIRLIKNTWVDNTKIVMLYLPVASCGPVGAIYFYMNHISPASNYRIVGVLLMFATSVTVLCFIGQHFQDSFEEVFTVACNCPWTFWNKKNKMALLLLLMNSAKPVEISSYATIALNCRLLMTFHKTIYSLMTLMKSTT